MGDEFKKKGVNVLLGPVVGPAGRVVRGGRNWEGISIDPYLSGALVFESVTGIQDRGVITSTKVSIYLSVPKIPTDGRSTTSPMNKRHIETLITTSFRSRQTSMTRPCMNSISGKHTTYPSSHHLTMYRPFQDAVKAGTGNIMCSYQRINNSYGCANSKTLNGLLKTELGFQVGLIFPVMAAAFSNANFVGLRGFRLGRSALWSRYRPCWYGHGHG